MSLPTGKLGGPYGFVLDVGAFRGDFARACRSAWPRVEVVSFEPLEPRPDDAAWAWNAVALGAEAGRRTINRCEFVPSSSLLPMADLHKTAFPYAAASEPVEVDVVRLDDLAADELDGDPRRKLLKVDVQGSELDVLRGAERTLREVDGVVLEVSWEVLYHGAPTFAELDLALADAGFRHLRRVEELRHPRTRALLQSDEVWLRS